MTLGGLLDGNWSLEGPAMVVLATFSPNPILQRGGRAGDELTHDHAFVSYGA